MTRVNRFTIIGAGSWPAERCDLTDGLLSPAKERSHCIVTAISPRKPSEICSMVRHRKMDDLLC